MSVVCRILADYRYASAAKNSARTQNAGAVVMLDLIRSDGSTKRIAVPRALDVLANLGDRIKSVSGTAVILINPGTQAGAFILSPTLPPGADRKNRTELEIDAETTKIVCRGKISAGKDIGNIQLGGAATTR